MAGPNYDRAAAVAFLARHLEDDSVSDGLRAAILVAQVNLEYPSFLESTIGMLLMGIKKNDPEVNEMPGLPPTAASAPNVSQGSSSVVNAIQGSFCKLFNF
jgi:hypothetical protein